MNWINSFKEFFRDKFYDNVTENGVFICPPPAGTLEDHYHILKLTENHVTYKVVMYGYTVIKPKTVSRSEFKRLVANGVYRENRFYES
ncbi:hypothetical protein VP501E541_P0239 [Vibrio phage 501E54-1]|nr:hypothetical protein VP501E541_P0239 [Vibrio phage 501E54-1]